MQNDVVSLVKALHPTCLGGNVPLFTVSRSAKCLNVMQTENVDIKLFISTYSLVLKVEIRVSNSQKEIGVP